MYQIFVANYDRWVLEGETSDKQSARLTIKTIRAGGRSVMILKDGKKVSWKIWRNIKTATI